MKKTFLLPISAACMLMLGTAALAQGPAQAQPQTQQSPQKNARPKLSPDQKVDKEMAEVNQTIKLTPEQDKQLRDFFKNQNEQREQNKVTANGDQEKLKSLNKGLHAQRADALRKILTQDQLTALKAAKQQRNDQPQPAK